MQFIDTYGFAGAFTAGATQAGFTLIAKKESSEMGGFGMPICEANHAFLGDKWEAQVSSPEEWEVPSGKAELLIGNPPCSLAGLA